MLDGVKKAAETVAEASAVTAFAAGVGYGLGWIVGKVGNVDPVKFGLVSAVTLAAQGLISFGVDRTSLNLADKEFVKGVSNNTINGVSCLALFKLGLMGAGWSTFFITLVVHNLASTVINRIAEKQKWTQFKAGLIKDCSSTTIMTASLVTCASLGIIGPVGIGVGAAFVTLSVALILGKLYLASEDKTPPPVIT
jgi:hypothetical protein